MAAWRKYLLSTISGIIFVIMIILWIAYFRSPPNATLGYVGMFLWLLGAVFGIVPIFTFKSRGAVRKGESYMRTNKLVDTGIYSIVRHPQYTAWPILFAALVLMTQEISMAILGAIGAFLAYYDVKDVDEGLIEKFGDEYRDYMKKVPKMNFLLGIYRKIKKR